jgi:hypothetical protein
VPEYAQPLPLPEPHDCKKKLLNIMHYNPHGLQHELRFHPYTLSEGGQETTARLRVAALHPTMDVVLAHVDSDAFVIMSRSLPTASRLST